MLAQECNSVYLDTSILNLDKNYNDIEEHQKEDCGFAIKLGYSDDFSGIKQSILLRQKRHSSKLYQLINNHSNIKSTTEVIAEYGKFIEHIERSNDYFTENSKKKKKGKKGLILAQIIHNHNQIIRTLTKRSKSYLESEGLIELIKDQKLHLPKKDYLTKKTAKIKSCPDQADASLFAHALVDSDFQDKEVAIITCDFDIANIAYNYRYSKGKNPKNDVVVYFPDINSWAKDFSIEEKSRTNKRLTLLTSEQSLSHDSDQPQLIKTGSF